MQEGVASEASSLAGHLRLGKLVVLYDDNRIQLDGPTAWAFSEDVLGRYAAYGWHTQRVEDGNDVAAISAAIDAAKADGRPSIIAVRTHIGYGSPNKQDTQKAHGAPLGPDEVRLVKEAYGWDPDRTFYVPDEAAAIFRRAIDAGKDLVAEWESRFDRYAAEFPAEAAELRAPPAGAPSRTAGTRACPRTRWAPRSRRATRARTRSRRWPARCPSCSAAPRTCRVEPHRRQGERPRPLRGRSRRAQPAVRRPRARDGLDRERHRLPRRPAPLLRDVPHLQRLHARSRPARLAARACT